MSEADLNSLGLALEVLVDTKEPKIYLMNRPEILVGSLDTNDIVINQSEISRKHLKLFFVNKTVYVADQGSTNGTFLNDTKLVPGKRAEFMPFMSIRLGSKVLLTLISKERPDVAPDMSVRENFIEEANLKRGREDKTRVISLKELSEAKTQKIQKKRQDKLAKRKLESDRLKKEKAALKHVMSIAAMWLVVGSLLNFIWISLPDKAKRIFGVREKREVVMHVMDEFEEGALRLPKDILLSRTSLQTFLGSKACFRKDEDVFCNNIPLLREGDNGAIKLKTSYVLMFEKNSVLEMMENWLLEVAPGFDPGVLTEAEKNKMAFLYLIEDHFKGVLPAGFSDTPLYFVLFTKYGDKYKLQSVGAFRSFIFGQIHSTFESLKISTPAEFIKSNDGFYYYY